MSEENPETALHNLIESIAESTHSIKHKQNVPDLSRLEEQAARICRDIESLPPEQAKEMEGDLLRMISGLEALSEALEDLQKDLSAHMPDKTPDANKE